MSILLLLPPQQRAAPKDRAWSTGPSASPPPDAHLPPPPALTAGWRLGSAAHPVPGSSLTKGNNSDKGIKIASNDGKHFVEGSVDKRGNRAVKKRGGEGHWGCSGSAVTGPGTQK